MYKLKIALLVLVVCAVCQVTNSQNNTNSPYTRFGYGDISNNTNGEQRAMGGITTATRSNKSINPANPASYTAVDSMTFMFDVGASCLITHLADPTGYRNTFNGNLEYITLQFPIGKWIGISAGLLPYSLVGYDMTESDSLLVTGQTDVDGNDTYAYWTKSYYGQGGISQVYIGLSFELFKHVSIGANAYYMFGTVENMRSLSFTSSSYTSVLQGNYIEISDFRFRYGIQAYHTFAKKHNIVLGATYEHKSALNGSFLQIETNTNDTTDVSSDGFDLPMCYGVGIQYTYDNRLMISADYNFQNWADARYFGKTDSLQNRTKLAIGAEYRHNPMGQKYLHRMAFRAGLNVSNSYITGTQADFFSNNIGASVGVGFPLRNSNTVVNTAFEYGRIGSLASLREDYFKFTISISLNESWFFKRRL